MNHPNGLLTVNLSFTRPLSHDKNRQWRASAKTRAASRFSATSTLFTHYVFTPVNLLIPCFLSGIALSCDHTLSLGTPAGPHVMPLSFLCKTGMTKSAKEDAGDRGIQIAQILSLRITCNLVHVTVPCVAWQVQFFPSSICMRKTGALVP